MSSDSEEDLHASGGDDGSLDDGGAGSDAGAESAGEGGSAGGSSAAERPASRKRKRGPAALQPEQLAEFEAAEKRTGVVSRRGGQRVRGGRRQHVPWAGCASPVDVKKGEGAERGTARQPNNVTRLGAHG
jgi:hypothetical protein